MVTYPKMLSIMLLEKQSFIEGKISELENKIRAEVIDTHLWITLELHLVQQFNRLE